MNPERSGSKSDVYISKTLYFIILLYIIMLDMSRLSHLLLFLIKNNNLILIARKFIFEYDQMRGT